MADYSYRVPENYSPLALDYHYRLEWDLTKDHEFSDKHQVRIFDQGGEKGWNLFMDHKAQMEQAQEMGIIENMSAGCREVRLGDWEWGWPTPPPNLGT